MLRMNDLFLAAYLFTKGIRAKLEYGDEGKVNFLYPETPEIEEALIDYDNGALINVLEFRDAYRTCRSQMMNVKDRSNLLQRRINYGTRSTNQTN